MPSPAQSAETRHRLLEAAGEVFADQGFRAATIQAICLRAGANIAAVHYHFGDKERLYRAVIDYAGQFIHHAPPPDAGLSPEEQLRRHVESFLLHLLDEGRPAWHGRLMAREMFEPTGALDVIVQQYIRGTHQRLRDIVGALLGPDATDDDVRRCAYSVVGQCLFYRHSQAVIARLTPEAQIGRAQVPVLAEHITHFSLAGIRAIAERRPA
jgi:AcrR family transcriptional regulator